MKWIKYRHCWASGADDWNFKIVTGLDEANSFTEAESSGYTYNEMYRGVDWLFIKAPPPWVIPELIKDELRAARTARRNVKNYEAEFERLKHVTPDYKHALTLSEKKSAKLFWDQAIARPDLFNLTRLERKYGMPLEDLAKRIKRKVPNGLFSIPA